ncbi:MAG: enoyl-CoA hydratase/isomerase [Caldilineaceae bacterium]
MSGYKAMAYQTLRVRQQPGVQFVQIYRPEANNAINATLVQELAALIQAVEADPSINVIVLEGLPEVFCSGMDFQEYVAETRDEAQRTADFFTFLRQLAESSKVIVAKVQGKVNAGGIGLVAVSDLVVAESSASFGLSELLFGLLPAMVLPFLIQRLGRQKAKLLALTTQPISAAEAQQWGLVDIYGADVEPLLRPYLQRWRRLSPLAIRRLKRYLNQLQPLDEATQTLAVKTIAEVMADPAIKAGIRRYVEEGVAPWSR